MDHKETGISLLKGGVGAIPFVGTALNELTFDYRSRVKQNRLNEFLLQVADRLKGVEKSAVDADYLKSDEFVDFVESVLEKAVRTSREQKRSRLRDVLCRQVTQPVDTEFAEVFLSLASEISENEMRILIRFRDAADYLAGQPPVPELDEEEKGKREAHLKPGTYGISEADYKFFLQHLCARGLLVDDSMNRIGTRPLEIVLTTEFGRGFLEFIA